MYKYYLKYLNVASFEKKKREIIILESLKII